MYLLDTNAISETAKPKPNAGLTAWLDSVPPTTLFISALTIGEISHGIEKLPAGERRRQLTRWAEQLVRDTMRGRIIPLDTSSAQEWGRLYASARQAIPVLDGLIAATAIVRDFKVVTRNERHFIAAGAGVFNPWT